MLYASYLIDNYFSHSSAKDINFSASISKLSASAHERYRRFVFGSSHEFEEYAKANIKDITHRLSQENKDMNRLIAAMLLVLNPPYDDYTFILDHVEYDFSDRDRVNDIHDLQTWLSDPMAKLTEYDPTADDKKQPMLFEHHMRRVVCETFLDELEKVVDDHQFKVQHGAHVNTLKHNIQASRSAVKQLYHTNKLMSGTHTFAKVTPTQTAAAVTFSVSAFAMIAGVAMLHSPAAPLGVVLIAGGMVGSLGYIALWAANESGLTDTFFARAKPATFALPLGNLRNKLGLPGPDKNKTALVDDDVEMEEQSTPSTEDMLRHGMFKVATHTVSENDRLQSERDSKRAQKPVKMIKDALDVATEGACMSMDARNLAAYRGAKF